MEGRLVWENQNIRKNLAPMPLCQLQICGTESDLCGEKLISTIFAGSPFIKLCLVIKTNNLCF
jgi:hypothetical protein